MNSTYILLLPSVEGSVSHFPIPNSLSCTLWRLGLFAKSAPCLEGLSGSSSGTEKIIHQPWNPLNNKGFKDLIVHQIPSQFFNNFHPGFILIFLDLRTPTQKFWRIEKSRNPRGFIALELNPPLSECWGNIHRVADLRAPLSLPKIHLGGADSRDVVDRCHGLENEMST